MDGRATIGILRIPPLSKSVAGSADVNLSTVEAAAGNLKFTGAITANINIVVPAEFLGSGHFLFAENATTGAFTLTVKGPTGTGIVVATGKRAILMADGTNWTRWTADT